VVSSPGFVQGYFNSVQGYDGPAVVWENRICAFDHYPPAIVRSDLKANTERKIRVGYVGGMRCTRSLEILSELADRLHDDVEIHLHGYMSSLIPAQLQNSITNKGNVTYHGRYTHPQDLAGIYAGIDVVWAGDLSDGLNSRLLLPNRIYEGGHYGAVPIAPNNTEVASWVSQHSFGYTIDEPLQASLIALLGNLTLHQIEEKRQLLGAAPSFIFCEDRFETRKLLDQLLYTAKINC